jgi:2'-5' RNA ligase
MRLFFALWPDDGTRAALASAGGLLSLRDGRPVADTDLHLTLAFVGEVAVERVAGLCAMAATLRLPQFELEIAAAGWWRRSRVAWLAPVSIPAPLATLAAALHHGAGLEAESPASYRPHITVARRVRRLPGLLGGFSVRWPVGDFALISSNFAATGARYQVLAQWPLMPAVFD